MCVRFQRLVNIYNETEQQIAIRNVKYVTCELGVLGKSHFICRMDRVYCLINIAVYACTYTQVRDWVYLHKVWVFILYLWCTILFRYVHLDGPSGVKSGWVDYNMYKHIKKRCAMDLYDWRLKNTYLFTHTKSVYFKCLM